MPIQEVRKGMRVEGDHVYVIPAGADIGLSDGRFRVQPRAEERGRELPIDHFLRSLAEQYKSRAVGVVLSGTLSDGALGLRAIKAEGGMTFAQDEATAKFRDMPRAAIAAGAVDFVLPPEKIAVELARMAKHPYVRPVAPALPEPIAEEGPDHRRLLKLVLAATGVDFTNYRQTTVGRRIARRMALRKMDSLRQYVELLSQEASEIYALHDDILITVTSFFRDPEVFESLKETVFPSFRQARGSHAPIRIWIPGCSTGEEVYSLAIALIESLQGSESNPTIQIFGTDVSEAAVDKARAGNYLDGAMADVSPERLRRFFVKTDRGWQISKSVRDVCIFAKQNVTSDPPFSNLDLISCRNLLIYLEPVLQKRVLPLFHYALRPLGYLLLGNAESIAGYGSLFVPVDRERRIFAKRPGSVRQFVDFGPRLREADGPAAETGLERPQSVDLQKEADRVVLGRYGPASVLINDDFEILQFRGRTSPYLEPAPGAASYNVLKMAREGLLVDLRTGIQKARRSGRPVRKEGLHVRQDGSFRDVNLEVVPLRQDAPGFRHFLILFEDAPRKAKTPSRASGSRTPASRRVDHETIVKLEQELTSTKDYLQAIIEEQEASNEELKSANEEILSANEELQSTNEELETAKEELQSTNEELTTLNEELQNRNAELTEVNNDVLNFLTGTDVAIVMLNRDGRLRRYTPQAEALLNISPTDVGRRIGDLKTNLRVTDLTEVVSDVVAAVAVREREIQDQTGRWYLMRARPYRTMDNRIDGAVLGFFDIDPLKTSLEVIDRARDYAETLIETVRESLVVLDASLKVRSANQAFYRTFEANPESTEGRDLLELLGLEKTDPHLRERLAKASRDRALKDYEVELDGKAREPRTLLLNARPVHLEGEARILLAIDDVTERKAAEVALRASESRYRRIFETAREGIWILDGTTGEILDVNPYVIELLGYRRSDLVGRKSWESGIFENPSLARQRFRAARANGFSFEPEVALRTQDGRRVVVETITNSYETGDQKVMQGNIRDITERVRLQDQLRQVQKLDSIGRLAGGIAHDFNNLLNIISAHVGLLQRPGEEKRRAESATAIQKAVERGTAVVRQLLTFARKGETSYELTDVNTVLREVASMLRETFPKQTRVATKLAENLPPIQADPNQIHQAILNLAVNARDAMPDGGTLTLGTDDVDGDVVRRKFPEVAAKRFVELCVSDTGTGMDEETLRRIFEPFFSTKGSGGQGLGLAVVYGIVNSHHGVIDLESEPGKGSTFRIYLPVMDGAAPGTADPDSGETKREPAAQDQRASGRVRTDAAGRLTLLLVEDEETLLAPIRTILEEEGYAVLTAADGLEAVRLHAENVDRISAVLLDLSLPRLGGWQAFQRMRELDPQLRCIVASGNIDPEQRADMRRQGVDITIRKPYGWEEMLTAIRKVLSDA